MLVPGLSNGLGEEFSRLEVADVAAGIFPQPNAEARVPGLPAFCGGVGPELASIESAFRQPIIDLVPIYDRAVEVPTIYGARLFDEPRPGELVLDDRVFCAVENRRPCVEAESFCSPAEVGFEHLAEVHPGRHADRVKDDVQRPAIRHERQVFLGQYLGDDALVTVAARHLVALGDLAGLRDPYAHHGDDAGRQLVSLFLHEHAHVYDLTVLAVRDPERRVLYVPGFLSEYRPEQLLLGGQFSLALRSDLADQNVAWVYPCADANDAHFVEVAEAFLAHVRDVACDLFRSQLCFSCFDLVLFYVDRSETIVFDQRLADDDGVLVVVAFPTHEADQEVLSESQLAIFGRRTVGEGVAFSDDITLADDGVLVNASPLVGADKLDQREVVDLFFFVHHAHTGTGGGHYDAIHGGVDHLAAVSCDASLHAGPHERSLRADQRHGLALHVRTHKGAVGVVVFEERNQGGRDTGDLHGRNVHEFDRGSWLVRELFSLTNFHERGGDLALCVHRRGRLADHVQLFVVCRQIDDVLRVCRYVRLDQEHSFSKFVDLLGNAARNRLARLRDYLSFLVSNVNRRCTSRNVRVFGTDLVQHAAVRGFNEPELVYTRVRRQGAKEANIRSFRRFDGADAAIVGVVHVPHVEASAFS